MFIAKSIVQFLSEGNFIIFFTHLFLMGLINCLCYFYFLTKVYRLICYFKITFDWLPMLNPYEWPFSFFATLTRPYFEFWQRNFPTIKFGTSSIQIYTLIGIEMLNAVLYLFMRMIQCLLKFLEVPTT